MRAALALTTDRLLLRPLVEGDAQDLHEVLDDPELHRYTGGDPPSLPALRERLRRWEAGGPADRSERWLNWIVRRRDDRTPVGHVQATVRDDHADLAWVVGTAWQRRGYATEAATAVAAALRAGGVARLSAHIHPDHVASQRVAMACGLARTPERDADGEELWSS